MESVYLKTLVEVSRSGNLTKAAETLCVSQSAVSRRIKFMEEQYGTILLDRSGPVLRPTAAGSLVVEQAQKIINIEQNLLQGLTTLQKKKELNFACTPAFGIVHLPDILRKFMLLQPEAGNLKFALEMPEEIVSGLRNGVYEMAVVEHCRCFDLSDFETAELPPDEMVFAGAPGLRSPSIVTVEELFQHTLFSRHEGCCSRTLLEANLSSLDRKVEEFRRIVIYDDLHVIVNSLLKGDGIAFISSEVVEPYIRSGQLVSFKVSGFDHQRCRTFVFNSGPKGCLNTSFVKTILSHFPEAETKVDQGTCLGQAS